jgi:hypothetical protein
MRDYLFPSRNNYSATISSETNGCLLFFPIELREIQPEFGSAEAVDRPEAATPRTTVEENVKAMMDPAGGGSADGGKEET